MGRLSCATSVADLSIGKMSLTNSVKSLSLEDDELYHPQHPQSLANLPTPDQFPTHSPSTAVAIIYLPRGRGAFVWVHSIDTWVYCHGRIAQPR